MNKFSGMFFLVCIAGFIQASQQSGAQQGISNNVGPNFTSRYITQPSSGEQIRVGNVTPSRRVNQPADKAFQELMHENTKAPKKVVNVELDKKNQQAPKKAFGQ